MSRRRRADESQLPTLVNNNIRDSFLQHADLANVYHTNHNPRFLDNFQSYTHIAATKALPANQDSLQTSYPDFLGLLIFSSIPAQIMNWGSFVICSVVGFVVVVVVLYFTAVEYRNLVAQDQRARSAPVGQEEIELQPFRHQAAEVAGFGEEAI